MYIDSYIIAIVLTALVTGVIMFIAGYIHGSYSERKDRYSLINEDRLPHPFDRR